MSGEKPPADPEQDRSDRDPVEFDSATPPLEWAIAVIGALFAATILGFLLVQSIGGSEQPPLLSAEVADVTAASGIHVARVEVRNIGERAASNVRVQGRLIVDGRAVEEASATVDYIPVGTERTVMLQFAEDPSQGRLELSSLGFVDQ